MSLPMSPPPNDRGESPNPLLGALDGPHPQTDNGLLSGHDVRRRKRQKISLACEECRARKVRCDGVRPQCSACRRKRPGSNTCTYLKDQSKPSSERRLLQSFNERLAQLEGRLNPAPDTSHSSEPRASQSLQDALVPSESITHESAGVPTPQEFSSMGLLQARMPALSDPKQPPRTRSHEDNGRETGAYPDDESGSITAMGMSHVAPGDVDSKSGDFYGKSSAASLLSHIQDRLNPSSTPRSQDRNDSNGPPGPSRPSHSTSEGPRMGFFGQNMAPLDDYDLPPRQLADHLLDLYHTRAHCLYPYIHWPTLMTAYRRLWMSDVEIKNAGPLTGVGIGSRECSYPVFYCALNAIFALGAQFSAGSAQEKRARARPFSIRARHLLRLDYLDHGDLALVQALLIMAHYLQSTNLPTRCWSVVGVAYRMAQGLGLHLEMPEGAGSALRREMRRRVWHGCLCLDTVLGMTLGRPCLNSRKSAVEPPSMLEEEQVASPPGTANNADAASNLIFFTQTIRLYKILANILGQVYDPWKESEACKVEPMVSGSESTLQISSVVGIDSDLDVFEATVPDSLRWSTVSPNSIENTVLQRQRNVLRTRLLHTRVLLHRPLFVQLCQMHFGNDRQSSSHGPVHGQSKSEHQLFKLLAERCSLTCVQNAQILIDHICSTSQTPQTGAPWFNSYYVYHSAMVLTLAEFSPSVRERLDQASLSNSWDQCLEFLNQMVEHDPESYRYMRTLRDISHYVQREGSGANGNSAESTTESQDARQGFIVHHITNPCLDPSAASWLDENVRFDMYTQFGNGDTGFELFKDPAWSLTGVAQGGPLMNPMMGEWSTDGSGGMRF